MSEALKRVRILNRRDETPDIASFALAAEEGDALPPFEAGAHIDVEAKPGVVRQFSLLELPNAEGVYRIGVLKDAKSRGGSAAMYGLRASWIPAFAGMTDRP